MEMIGLDLHKRESQLAIKAEDGTMIDRRIVTSRERFTAVLGSRPRARILLEASTESEWCDVGGASRARRELPRCRERARGVKRAGLRMVTWTEPQPSRRWPTPETLRSSGAASRSKDFGERAGEAGKDVLAVEGLGFADD